MTAEALDRDWIASHLPHRGPMNLLHAIVSWDANGLRARATSHRDVDHPLRRGNELPIACGIEYGAQAVAAHGALVAHGGAAGAGFLASVRSVSFHATRLDDLAADLDIAVEQIGGGAGGMLYHFTVASDGRPLIEGRVAIMLTASRSPASP
jgi:predicted hotdog family 3-hydroxylacyl-ACP dehydratase